MAKPAGRVTLGPKGLSLSHLQAGQDRHMEVRMQLALTTFSIVRDASPRRGIRRCYAPNGSCHKPVNKPMIIVI